MRFAILASVFLVCSCASNSLKPAPPAGIDFSGHWKLNEADSDDPQRLAQSATAQAASPATGGGGSGGGPGGGSGGGARGGSRGGSASTGGHGMGGFGGPQGPVMPSITTMGQALRWPGKLMLIHQVGGAVTFTSDGRTGVCQPSGAGKSRHKPPPPKEDAPLPSERDPPPPRCGWEDSTLLIRSSEPDGDSPPFEQRFSLSPDGQRLIELVGMKGGRSAGFSMSRVWDKAQETPCDKATDPKSCN